MYRWHLALEGDAILSPEARTKLTTPYVREGGDSQAYYAYGWGVVTTPRRTKVVTHNGGNGIFEADFRRYIDEKAVIFVASNAEMSGIKVSGRVTRFVLGIELPIPPKIVPLPPAALARYAGIYRLLEGGALRVERAGRALGLVADGQPALDALSCADEASRRGAAALNRRSAALAEAGAQGDFRPLQEALGGRMPPERVRGQGSELWNSWTERLGDFKRLQAAGTEAGRDGRMESTLRLEFERGVAHLTYVWSGDTLDEVRPFNLDSGGDLRVSFLVQGGGAVSGMEIGGEHCLLRARRSGR
jgi:hypothetical protein